MMAISRLGSLTLRLNEEALSLLQTWSWISYEQDPRPRADAPDDERQAWYQRLNARKAAGRMMACLSWTQDDVVMEAARAAVEAAVGDQRVADGTLVPRPEAMPPEDYRGPICSPEECSIIVSYLEQAAVAVETDLSRTTWATGPEARELLAVLGHRVAGWLRARASA